MAYTRTCTPVGELNRDAQAACAVGDTDIEEVTYPAGHLAPAGWYTVRVDFWEDCDNGATNPIPYAVQVRIGDQLQTFCGEFTPSQADMGAVGSGVTIFQFLLLPDGGLI